MNDKLVNKILRLQGEQKEETPKAESLVIMMIAPPKFGKTTFFTSNPDSILLAFETGYRFRGKCAKLAISKWDSKEPIHTDRSGVVHCNMRQAIDFLLSTDKYPFVICDTVDMMAKECSDYHCGLKGVEHPGDAGDYGKGWDTCLNNPMRKALLQITHSGRGVGLITHSKTEILPFSNGAKARKESTLGGKVRMLCESQADIILHGEYGKKVTGQKKRHRILVTEDDNDTLAGNRSDCHLPTRFILSPTDPWGQFASFFTEENAAATAEAEYKKIYKK